MTIGSHIQFYSIGPAQHRKQITIGNGEAMAGQPLFVCQRCINVLQLFLKQPPRDRLIVLRGIRAEQRGKAFMQLGGHIVQPFESLIARNRAHRRQQMTIRHLVCDVLHDGYALSEQDIIIQQQRRHLTFRVELQIVFPVFQPFLGQIHALQGKIQTAFAQGNMRGKGTGAGFVEQFHA